MIASQEIRATSKQHLCAMQFNFASPLGRGGNAADGKTSPLSLAFGSTALPKGEPRTQRKSSCLPLRGRWHGASRDGEGKVADGKTSPLSLAPLDSSPKGRAKNAAEEPLPLTSGEMATPLTEKRALSVSLRSTALPKGEPRTQRKSPCLSLRGRWQRR